MTDNLQPTTARRGSDASPAEGEFSLDKFYESMKNSRRDRTRTVDLLVHPLLLDESIPDDGSVSTADDIVIHLAVTSIRQILLNPEPGEDPYPYRYPEFEVEGWLEHPRGRPFGEQIWVRCALRTEDVEVTECTVYRLEPGEELGTDKTLDVC